mmetsp:Transcript_46718/g.52247  ORF Transcript_46718/g.52247 Transcript_46718/m.52247 type:complete len:109 (-) Transcript_46718:138-464(-)
MTVRIKVMTVPMILTTIMVLLIFVIVIMMMVSIAPYRFVKVLGISFIFSSTINGNKDNGSVGGVGTHNTCRFSETGIIRGDGKNNNNEDKDMDKDDNGYDENEDVRRW